MKNTRVLLILVLAIVTGLGAGYSALRYLSDRPTPIVSARNEETVSVVLASRDLPLGKVLAEEDLTTVEWPGKAMPVGFASSEDELVGQSLISNVQANEPILANKLAEGGLRGLIPLIPTGMRALTVRVDDVIGVAGFVTPQTRVDVILMMQPTGGSEVVSKIILQNIEVLTAGTRIEESEEGEAIQVPVVTVKVTPEQAEKLALAANQGRIQMALRNTLDLESIETSGERASRLFSGVGPAPRTAVRTGATTPTTRESIIEIYRGGVRTLISY